MNTMRKEEINAMKKSVSDGIAEMIIGFMFMWWGSKVFGGFMGELSPIAYIFVWLIKPLKAKITYPRIGFFKLNKVRQRKSDMSLLFIITGILVLGIGAFYIPGARDFIRLHTALVFSMPFSILAIAAYLITRVWRFLVYGVLMVGGFVFLSSMRQGIDFVFLSSGGVMFITGLIILICFIKKNPITSNEE